MFYIQRAITVDNKFLELAQKRAIKDHTVLSSASVGTKLMTACLK